MNSVCVSCNLLEEAKTETGIPKPLHFHTAEMHGPPGRHALAGLKASQRVCLLCFSRSVCYSAQQHVQPQLHTSTHRHTLLSPTCTRVSGLSLSFFFCRARVYDFLLDHSPLTSLSLTLSLVLCLFLACLSCLMFLLSLLMDRLVTFLFSLPRFHPHFVFSHIFLLSHPSVHPLVCVCVFFCL